MLLWSDLVIMSWIKLSDLMGSQNKWSFVALYTIYTKVEDLNGDGKREIVVGSEKHIYVLGSNGRAPSNTAWPFVLHAEFPDLDKSRFIGSPVIEDFAPESEGKEVVVLSLYAPRGSSEAVRVHVLAADGTELRTEHWPWDLPAEEYWAWFPGTFGWFSSPVLAS